MRVIDGGMPRSGKGRAAWAAAVLLLSFMTGRGAAGQQMQMIQGSGGVLDMPGGGALVVVAEGGALVVRGVVAGTVVGDQVVDLLEGDLIVSLQGAAVATAEDLQVQYEALAEGDEVVLEILRNGERREVRFARPDREAGSKHVVTGGGSGAGAWTAAGPGRYSADEVLIAGARIRNNAEGMPEVVLRGSDPAAASVELRVGDVVTGVNGRSIAALAGLEMLYGEAAPGAEVTLTIRREGAERILRFIKPAGR